MRRSLASALALAALLPVAMNCAAKRKQSNSDGVTVAVNAATVVKATGATVRNAITGAAASGRPRRSSRGRWTSRPRSSRSSCPGAIVQRLGSGIVVTLPEGLLFAQESDQLTPASRDNLRRLATNLEKYPNTKIMIVGHTDSQGGSERNLDFSERRAQAIANFLVEVGVNRARLTVLGRGDAEPIATNDTDAGRQWNRRVEIAIYADEATRFGSRD